MKNPFFTIDDYIMQSVNTINQYWNWTTGRTKTELADLCFLTYGIEGAYMMTLGPDFKPDLGGTLLALIPLFSAGVFCKGNHLLHQLEERRKENTLNLKAEIIKRRNKMLAYTLGIPGALAQIVIHTQPALPQDTWSTLRGDHAILSAASFTLGFLVSTADNLPPRKNCLIRGIEHIANYYQTSHATT